MKNRGSERLQSFSIRQARANELQQLVAIDDDASELYAEAGIELALDKTHPFVVAESARWAIAVERGLAHIAVDADDEPIGFMTLGFVDGQPYLDQVAVRVSSMRHGVGTALLRYALEWSGTRPLWLTTYSHLPWNRPYYERHGFVVVPEGACGSELRAILRHQRSALPDPDKRVAMVCAPPGQTR